MNRGKIKKILETRIAIATLSSVIFYVSCWCPAFEVRHCTPPNDVIEGVLCLIMGFLGILVGTEDPWNLVWLANPIYVLSMLLFVLLDSKKGQNIALILCLCSITMGLSFSLSSSLILDESGSPSSVGKLYIGYYLWVLSFVVLLIGMLLYRKRILYPPFEHE